MCAALSVSMFFTRITTADRFRKETWLNYSRSGSWRSGMSSGCSPGAQESLPCGGCRGLDHLEIFPWQRNTQFALNADNKD